MGVFRRSWRQDHSAVSPVVGSILMVAITAVLVVTVMYVVSEYTKDPPEPAKPVALIKDEPGDQILLTRSDTSLDWSDYSVTATVPLRFGLNTQVTAQSGSLVPATTYVPAADADAPFTANDFLNFCSPSGPVRNVDVFLRSDASKAVVGQYRFSVIQSCV